MALDYNPKDAESAWPEADYDAILTGVKTTTSKVKPDGTGGNPMEVWTVQAYHPDGRTQDILEYVVIPGATFKIKQLAAALGKTREFEQGQFQAENYINASFTASLCIESQDGFDDKNKVKKFKPPTRQPSPQNGAPPAQRQRPATRYAQAPVQSDDLSDVPF